MKSNLSDCVVQNSCVAGVCIFFRKATRRRAALEVTPTNIASVTSPNAASCLNRVVSQPRRPQHRPAASALRSLMRTLMRTPSMTAHRAVQSAKRRCDGSVLNGRKAGESSCTAAFARTGIEMIEALLDNAEQHQFVNHLRSARISSCWAWHWNLSNWRSPFIRRTSIELLFTTHNRCVRLDRNHCTGQNPGDKLSATR